MILPIYAVFTTKTSLFRIRRDAKVPIFFSIRRQMPKQKGSAIMARKRKVPLPFICTSTRRNWFEQCYNTVKKIPI